MSGLNSYADIQEKLARFLKHGEETHMHRHEKAKHIRMQPFTFQDNRLMYIYLVELFLTLYRFTGMLWMHHFY